MTRIGSFQQNQTIIAEMLRNQARSFDTQRQVATGHKAQHFSDIARESPVLIATKTVESRLEGFSQANQTLKLRLDTYDTTLRALEDVGRELKESVLDALTTQSGIGLTDSVTSFFDLTVGLLNTKLDSKYIFGGTNTDEAPVNISTVPALLALPEPPAGAFENNQVTLSAKVDDSLSMDYGILADALGQDLLQAMQRILLFESGTLPVGAGAFGPAGPFNDPLDANQRDFLTAELTQLEVVARDLTTQASLNGINQQKLSEVQVRQEERLTVTKVLIGDLEDVDMAEAISQLNLDEAALESSLAVVSRMTQLTLLNFL